MNPQIGRCVLVPVVIFALWLLGACSAESARQASRDMLRDTLKQMISDAYDFSRPGVVERMTALYATEGQLVSASEGAVIASRDSIKAGIARFWENAGKNMKNPRWEWGEVFVEQFGQDGAALTASWSIQHIAPNGRPHVISGAWTAVFKRTPVGWKIVQEHLSAG